MSHVSVEPTQVSYHTSQHITTQHPTFGQNNTRCKKSIQEMQMSHVESYDMIIYNAVWSHLNSSLLSSSLISYYCIRMYFLTLTSVSSSFYFTFLLFLFSFPLLLFPFISFSSLLFSSTSVLFSFLVTPPIISSILFSHLMSFLPPSLLFSLPS